MMATRPHLYGARSFNAHAEKQEFGRRSARRARDFDCANLELQRTCQTLVRCADQCWRHVAPCLAAITRWADAGEGAGAWRRRFPTCAFVLRDEEGSPVRRFSLPGGRH